MAITDNDIALFRERAKTELASGCDVSRLRWDDVVEALCNEVVQLRTAVHGVMDNLKIHAASPCETISINHAEIDAMIADCRAALSAPPGNPLPAAAGECANEGPGGR